MDIVTLRKGNQRIKELVGTRINYGPTHYARNGKTMCGKNVHSERWKILPSDTLVDCTACIRNMASMRLTLFKQNRPDDTVRYHSIHQDTHE